MTPTRFDEIVPNEANRRVQAKVAEFRNALRTAVIALLAPLDADENQDIAYLQRGEELGWKQKDGKNLGPSTVRRIFGVVLSTTPNEGWPSCLWERTREEVVTEILAKMDVVQQAMMAPPPAATDCRP